MRTTGLKAKYGGRSGLIFRSTLPVLLIASAARSYAAEAAEEKKADDSATEYRNWVEVGGGSVFSIDGDRPAFQQRRSLQRGGFGGIEDLHYEQDVGKRGLLTLDGRAIYDNHDYNVRVGLSHPDIGYVRGGYREFRTWYDGSGGFFPPNDLWFSLYDEDFSLDRGEAWVEGGLTLPDWPEIRLRYSYDRRDGRKDSTSWGDTGLTGLPSNNLRGIVPSFWDIDEQRHTIELDARHDIGNTVFGAGVRYELSDNDNSRNMRRRPGELPPVTPAPGFDRFVTHREGFESDLFNAHGFTETRFGAKVLFTTGYSFTTLDTDISGSRIYGSDYDPVYDPLFARRQNRDHGFLDLGGGSQLQQHVVNANLMLTPWEHVTIVPSVRFEHQDQEGQASFLETSVSSSLVTTETPIENTRDRGFSDLSEGIEVRYTGLTNWAFYVRSEWLQGEGDLEERESEADTGLVFRETDSTRFTQKYVAGANWYPYRRFNVGGQYYFKSRENDYDHSLDSTDNDLSSGDRYPAFFKGQDFSTHDANVRTTWRVLPNLTLVSRYDFQISDIDTHPDELREVQTAESIAHIFSQSISWTPLSRLYVQGSLNYVLDQTDTDATEATPGTNLVQQGENNYWNATALVGVVLTEKTDFQAHYSYYRADNYEDNSDVTVPYGAGAEDHAVMGTLIHRLSKRMQVSLRYGFFAGHDQTYGGHNDYTAHMVYSTLRYVF
jgi:hypothetical protein